MTAKKKKWGGRYTGFLAVPRTMVVADGSRQGLLWTLAREHGADAVLLYLYLIARGQHHVDGKPNKGNVRGPRTAPYSLIRGGLGWSPNRIARVLKTLIEGGWIEPCEDGRRHPFEPLAYRIGQRHPWVAAKPKGKFLALVNALVVANGKGEGLLWRLVKDAGADAGVLLLYVLARGKGQGGTDDAFTCPYSIVERDLGWSSKRVARAFRCLLERGWIIREPRIGKGLKPPNLYRVGPAHPWTKMMTTSAPDSSIASAPDSSIASAPDSRGEKSLPPSIARTERGKSRTHIEVVKRLRPYITQTAIASAPDRESRSSHCPRAISEREIPLRGDRGDTSPRQNPPKMGGHRGDDPNARRRGPRLSLDAAAKLTDWIGHLVGRSITPEELARAAEIADAPGDYLTWTADDVRRIADWLRKG